LELFLGRQMLDQLFKSSELADDLILSFGRHVDLFRLKTKPRGRQRLTEIRVMPNFG
jgi:hypothetical protein